MVKLWAAERKCANAIYDLIGYPHIEAATAANPSGYGVNDIPEGTETPWGTTVERSESCGRKVIGAYKSFWWDGVVVGGGWGTVEALAALTLGYNPKTHLFTRKTKVAALSNLGLLVVGLTIPPTARQQLATMPGPTGDLVRRSQQTVINTGKGLIAYDKWDDDPFAAAGEATFNVTTILVPAGAVTTPIRLSTSATAAAIRTTAKVMKYTDPLGLAIDGTTRLIKTTGPVTGDVVRSLDLSIGRSGSGIEIPSVSRTDVTLETPRTEITGGRDDPHHAVGSCRRRAPGHAGRPRGSISGISDPDQPPPDCRTRSDPSRVSNRPVPGERRG